MTKKLFIFNVLIVVILLICRFEKSSEDCICNVRLRGEYCGSELNRRNGNSDCQSTHMYFCGDGNEGKSPKLLVQCADESECEQNQSVLSNRARRRNPCLRRFKCQCPPGIGRGPHCGSKLVGEECPPDMIFICRRRSGLDSRDICTDGCNNGRCITGVDSGRERDDDSDRDRSDDESDTEP